MGEKITNLITYMIWILKDQRGEVGDEDNFSKEELETLGEEEKEGLETRGKSEEEIKAEEEAETKQKEEEEKAEEEAKAKAEEEAKAKAEEEDKLIPQSRLDRMRWEKGEVERKHELLKRNPEEYYEQYPDEKPEEETKEKISTVSKTDIWNMVIEGGPYDGKTLTEAYDDDPKFAIDLYNDYRDDLRKTTIDEETKANKLKEDSEKEINTFSQNLSKEMFGKEVDALSEDEGKKIDTEINSILGWMGETGRGGGNIGDAYFLMNKDKILAETQGKGIQAIVHATQQNLVSSIDNKKSSDTKTGYDADLNITRDDLAAKLEKMNEEEEAKYMKNAPQSLKDKFPDLAWD